MVQSYQYCDFNAKVKVVLKMNVLSFEIGKATNYTLIVEGKQ